MNAKPIIFRKGEENGIVVERDHFENSIMLNQYQQAIDIFNRLWAQQYKQIEKLEKNNGIENDIWIDNKTSNIIAFCGDRGEGKSSCMASFATMLTDKDVQKEAKKVLAFPKDENNNDIMLSPDKIEWLDVLDPSFFDDQHNLLELLLGRVSQKAQEKIKRECEKDCSKTCSHRELMEQLQRVRKCISVMAPKKGDATVYDTVEEMSDLAAGMQLKTELQTLFKCYLKFVGKECLLICIDDLDLNIKDGYQMSEMLRKYLINPYCIVLVSVKIEQLIDVIATEHKKAVKDTDIKWEECQQMAQKYVAKLLPRGNRVVMPVAEDFCERELQIADEQGLVNLNEPIYTVKEKVVQMIFQKTGYVFYNTQRLSPIIPRNLRSLRHLLGLLCTLPDARDENWEDDDTGKDAFKDYFFGTWAAQQLSEKDFSFAQKLAYYDDLSTMNAFVVEHFAKRVREDEKIEIEKSDVKDEYTKLYLNIISNQNTATNISFGDVMYVLWLVNGITLRTEIQNLIFFIKTIYSMRLYACYNVISRGPDDLFPPTPEVDKIGHIHRAETLYANVNQLQRLLNGSYFTYPQGALLPSKDDNIYRDRTIIHVDKLTPIINGLFKNETALVSLRVCEYLALCVTRTTSNTEQNEDKGLNRTEKVPTYLGQLSTSANYFVFDFLQPFYSLVNIKYAYQRFDDIIKDNKLNEGKVGLLDIATTTDGSLFKELTGFNGQLPVEQIFENMHHLISDAVIRVTDVQWAIYDELLRTRRVHKSGDDAILQAYGDIQKLKIKLYHLIRKDTQGEDASILKFSFLNFLKSIWDKENTAFRQSLETLLYISPQETLTIEMAEFTKNLAHALRRVLIWPMSGKELRNLISNSSKLKGTQKSSFTRLLKHVINDDGSYQLAQVLELSEGIAQQYLVARSK